MVGSFKPGQCRFSSPLTLTWQECYDDGTMSHDLPLVIAFFAPVLVLVLLGVNAAMVFLSLCLGQVLVKYVATDAVSGLTMLSPHISDLSKSSLQLAFLFAPAAVTTIIMIGSIRGKIRRLINILPALGVGLLTVILGVPLCTPGLRSAIDSGSLWQQLNRGQALVVGVSAFISLLFLWSQRRSFRPDEVRSSRHHG